MKKAKALRTVTAALTLALLLQAGAAAETTAPQTSEAVETAQSETSAAPATSPALQTSEVPAAPQTPPSPAAQTTVTVRFDLDGGTGTAPADISVQKGAQTTLPGGEGVAKAGFVFRGWSNEKGNLKFAVSDSSVTVDEDITFYAVWSEDRDNTVTYKLGGAALTETVRSGKQPQSVPTADAAGRPVTGWKDADGLRAAPADTAVYADVSYTAVLAPELNTTEHVAFAQGGADGTFRPNDAITRAEAAQLLARVVKSELTDSVSFSDVAQGAWYSDAVTKLAGAGILSGSGGSFRPADYVSRAEFAAMLARFTSAKTSEKHFSDVAAGSWYESAVGTAAANGWIGGYSDGSFRPAAQLTRAEAVTMINRMLGRSADAAYLSANSFFTFFDVTDTDWFYGNVLEAALPHGYESANGVETWKDVVKKQYAMTPGMTMYGAELYYVGSDGSPVADASVDGHYFGRTGRYTTGNAELDGYVKSTVAAVTNGSMTQLQKLRALYNWTRDSFTYFGRDHYEIGHQNWTEKNALIMFETRQGNCYCYASVFYYLARQLGYNDRPIAGVVGTRRSPHGWVEIDFGGVTYIFDTELEMAYRLKGAYYNFFQMPYSAVPWPYVK